MKALTSILYNAFIFLFSVSAFTQAEEKGDSYEKSYLRLQELYEEAANNNRPYINGFLYSETFPGSRGHPFFQSETWYHGNLLVDGRQYSGLAVRYDLYRDQLLYNHIHTTGSYIIVLNIKLIEEFIIGGHTFRKMKEGYYELLSEGKASFFVKWQKRLSDPTSKSMGEFSIFNEWYILNNGVFRKVNGKSGLVKALEDHEKEIRRFIRENRILVKTVNEIEIKRIVDYYNSLEP
ncbi:MAG: hypothetical protein DRI98_06330 [Bacteroidetes bacterium]|nr:MAG: hypothetical protein DRI98_06330 [Bacteroidota bacterium]